MAWPNWNCRYVHVKSGRETNVRPRSDILPDASNHPQWNKKERVSEKKRSSALTWTMGIGRRSTPQPEAPHTLEDEEDDDEEVVANPRQCRRCGAVTDDACFKFCPECGDVLPAPTFNTRQQADKEALGTLCEEHAAAGVDARA